MMKTEAMFVTPEQARVWLKSNTENRPLRPMGVERLRAIWDRGEWRLTHQGIAFDKRGVLKDGQHRLHMVAGLPNGTKVQMLVTTGMEPDVFGALDNGIRRTMSDEMGIHPSLAAVATMLLRILDQKALQSQSARLLQPFVQFAEPHLTELLSFCGTSRHTWSSAPVRAAAVVQMARGHNPDFVKAVYRSLVLRDIGAMTPTARSLFTQVLDGKAGGARSLDLFARCLRVFDSMAPSISKVQIKDVSAVTADVRAFLAVRVMSPDVKKKGGAA